MRNPLTFRVESSLGALFISILSLFFVGILFISIKNFNTDIDVMSATYNNVSFKRISASEIALIRDWVKINKIEIPEGRGYNYLLHKYPDRPWIN